MSEKQFNNVVETYLSMEETKGNSAPTAIMSACEATNRKFNAKYVTQWANQAISVPDDVVRWMQIECGYFAAQMIGIKASKEKAKAYSLALSTPVKKDVQLF